MPAELLERAARVLRAEARDGYRDRVVMGGLSAFVHTLEGAIDVVPEVARVASLLRNYAALDPADREARLSSALEALTGGSAPSAVGDNRVRSAGDRSRAVPRAWGAPATVARSSAPNAAEPPPHAQLVRGRSLPPPPGLSLDTPIAALKGIGQVRGRLYARLNLHTVRDLLFHFPTRHQVFPDAQPIASLLFAAEGTVVGALERLEVEPLKGGLKRLRATVRDSTGSITAVWLRHGLARLTVQTGERIIVTGPLKQQGRSLIFDNPAYERADGARLNTQGLVPIYPLTAGLSDRELRNRIHWAVTHFAGSLSDPLPEPIRSKHGLPDIATAMRVMHFPDSAEEYAAARRRFAFEELLTIQLVALERRLVWQQDPAAALPTHRDAVDALVSGLPFALTGAQQRVTDEILADLSRPQPMTRLVQGEVGSGKTAVAAMALINTVANDRQGVLMAPTEILAEQHYATISRMFESAGPALERVLGRRPEVRLLTGSVATRERSRVYAEASTGIADVLIGTQALIQDKLEFNKLALVIVDEQHRFGVRQRVTLRQRASAQDDPRVPHLLVMTATPIPRTLALSLYGDLDLSAINEMPPGRVSPKTVLLGTDERHLAYERVRRAVEKGEQAFIICPLVEESEVLEAKSAVEEYERLRTEELASLRLGLLHGRMKPVDKDATMRAFRDHEFDVLVSTAVVEVGVDIPNATVMLIEGAERFGLAQLHQFRGRVGRGGQPAVCVLLTDQPDPEANERLRVVRDTTDGLALAEHDLRLRGPGDYFGVRQSGMPELKVARLDDAVLVEAARSAAAAILAEDHDLERPEHAQLRAHLDAFVSTAGDPS